jgi:hypothetical protein
VAITIAPIHTNQAHKLPVADADFKLVYIIILSFGLIEFRNPKANEHHPKFRVGWFFPVKERIPLR